MKPSVSDMFNKAVNAEIFNAGVTGTQASKAKKDFEIKENEKHEYEPFKYLKKQSSIQEILSLVKNKKMSINNIRKEIKKHLKNPEDLNDFLSSLISKEDRKETKEATGSGSAGGFEAPLFSEPKKTETKEATSTSSSGSYESPSIWAKSTSKKHWRGKRKTQIPGGKFVQVKKKCKRFPYCNQGDIKALNIFENETLKSAIKEVSNRYGLSGRYVQKIIMNEFETISK